MASQEQIQYIYGLLAICKEKGIELPIDLLEELDDGIPSKERASEIIDDIKFELGWEMK